MKETRVLGGFCLVIERRGMSGERTYLFGSVLRFHEYFNLVQFYFEWTHFSKGPFYLESNAIKLTKTFPLQAVSLTFLQQSVRFRISLLIWSENTHAFDGNSSTNSTVVF